MALSIGIVGGGLGGCCVAIALRRFGHNVDVYERAARFDRVGADVNLTPNAVSVLDEMGCGSALRAVAARPTSRISRDGITGQETSRLPMSDAAREKYGAPQLAVHRGDLLDILVKEIPVQQLHFDCAVKTVQLQSDSTTVVLDNNDERHHDLVIGADGIHSVVRLALFGRDDPHYTGLVSWRSVVPRSRAGKFLDPDAFTKWWGDTPQKQIVTFPLTGGAETFVFATTPEAQWAEEGWTIAGDVEKLRMAYQHFHPAAQELLAACDEVTCSALHVREPMPQWSRQHVTLLGDAAHPMVPFMAQGACMAIEDSAVLARCLEHTSCRPAIEPALRNYELARKQRTATVQRMSLENEWMKKPGNADWLYGYKAWDVDVDSCD